MIEKLVGPFIRFLSECTCRDARLELLVISKTYSFVFMFLNVKMASSLQE